MELLLKESRVRRDRIAPGRLDAIARADDAIDRHSKALSHAVIKLQECTSRVHASMRLSHRFSMASLDKVTLMVLIIHMFVLALFGTHESWVSIAQVCFCGFYTTEMASRLKAANSFKRCDSLLCCPVYSLGLCAGLQKIQGVAITRSETSLDSASGLSVWFQQCWSILRLRGAATATYSG